MFGNESDNDGQGSSRLYEIDEVIARMVEMAESGDERYARALETMERADGSCDDEIIERTGLGKAIHGLDMTEFSGVDEAAKFVMKCMR